MPLWTEDRQPSKVLEAASEFNVQDTSPDLQHKFCALWNQIVLKAQNDDDRSMATYILKPIRNVYIALHQDTAPTRFSASTGDGDVILRDLSSYPLCNVTNHRTVPYDHAVLTPAPLVSPDAPSSPVPAPLRVDESLTTVPPLDDVTTGAMRDVVTSTITARHYTPDTSTSTPLSSTSPPAAVSPQHNADFLTPSDPPSHPPSTSSKTVLDNILPTDLHRSIIVTTASSSPGPTSALDSSTAADGGGSTKPSLRSNKDAGPLSVNRSSHPLHCQCQYDIV
ncbi:hypothetical protein EDB84DRAFT_1578111 [Lactarius hengduanensis]|nr:hypothetical protein EDB84DRAFT_1578111 [Lactarius hengduanensis]